MVSSTVAIWFTHNKALMASTIGALVLAICAKKLRYKEIWRGSGGSVEFISGFVLANLHRL